MKNKRMIDSWNKIEPDSAADVRMLDAILARNRLGQFAKRKAFTMNKAFNWKRLAPVAACLVMIIAVTAIFGNNAGWFGSKVYTAELSGGTLSFYKSDDVGVGSLDFGFEATGRDLTSEENVILFGGLDVTSYGLFNPTNKTLLHVEGRTRNTKVILAAPGLPTADWIIEGNEETSEIKGLQVTAGYFITSANSQGVKNIIYYASFALNDVPMYVESGGNLEESDTWKSEIASVIDTLIQNGTPNLSAITE